ncbi:hypothetical protein [Ruegeria sp.]|uniref:hypothetical protein n=1 Tax=Ruegeria sp. TaxID=1879320 RepID=UPI003B5CC8A3
MTLSKTLAVCLAFLSVAPLSAGAQTYKESFECEFGRGLANRPTPERVVFSLGTRGRTAELHEVNIPEIVTPTSTARVRKNSFLVLSIVWSGETYTYANSRKNVTTNEGHAYAVDLRRQEFSLFLDRRTMKAIARSRSSDIRPREGNATGGCVVVDSPN